MDYFYRNLRWLLSKVKANIFPHSAIQVFDENAASLLRPQILDRIQYRLKPMHPPDFPISEMICDDMLAIIKTVIESPSKI